MKLSAKDAKAMVDKALKTDNRAHSQPHTQFHDTFDGARAKAKLFSKQDYYSGRITQPESLHLSYGPACSEIVIGHLQKDNILISTNHKIGTQPRLDVNTLNRFTVRVR